MNKLILYLIFTLLFQLNFNVLKAQGPGNALNLDGYDGYVLSSTSNRGITNQVTLEAWVKTTAYKYQWVAGKYDRYGAERGYHLIIKDGKAAFAGRDNSGTYRNSGYSSMNVNNGQWHHLAGVCDGSKWLIYVDGILQSSITTNFSPTSLINNAPLAIGKYFLVDNEFYVGQIDEIRLWKKALSETEIRQNMCSKLSTITSDLVAYFNFDEAGTRTVKDLSSLRLDGTIQNQSTTASWKTSGAPIGDKSVYRYTSNWDAPLELVTDKANFSVTKIAPAIQGFHLYSIQSPPASTNGISAPQEVQEYYGLFKVGDANKKYKVYFKQYGLACGGKLFRRQDNTMAIWNQVADTVSSPIMLYTSSANYEEFAATPKKASPIKINGPTNVCAGSTATLHVTNPDNGQIVWSTGAKSPDLTVTKSGTYWVEVTTAGGCLSRDEITVTFDKEPATLLPEVAFVCYGEPVVLDATTEGATYNWSSGQVSPSITIDKPGTYTVTITQNNCDYIKEITVSHDECPVIPNIITPNGDGKNDTFFVNGVENNTLELKIFNRWGKSIYQSDRYDNGWSAADAPAGVYFYQFTSSRTHKVYKGWLEVIK